MTSVRYFVENVHSLPAMHVQVRRFSVWYFYIRIEVSLAGSVPSWHPYYPRFISGGCFSTQ